MQEDRPDFKALNNFAEFDADAHPVLYHYCDLSTFLAVIQFRKLRLSDINTMNDFSEFHWAYSRFEEAASLCLDQYDKKFFDDLDEIFSRTQLHTLPVLSCFSTEGDVLSQWKAYSDNGAGVAIGFDSKLLANLSIRIGKVTYSVERQIEFFRTVFALLFPIWVASKQNSEAHSKFIDLARYFAMDFALMKNPAFLEEQEVRIIRALAVNFSNDQWTLKDNGGSSADKPSRRKQEVQFRARDGGIIGFIDLPIQGLGNAVIKEVVLGPRSRNNGIEVSMALSSSGFKSFNIRKSTATYR